MHDNHCGQEALAVYFCGEEKCMPGHFFGPAVRPHYLMHVVLEGKGIFRHQGKEYLLEKGGAFLIRPGELTFYQADDKEPWEYAWVAFGGTDADRMLEKTGFCQGKAVWNAVCGRKDGAVCKEERAGEMIEHHIFTDRMRELAKEFLTADHNSMELTARFLLVMSCLYQAQEESSEDSYENRYLKKACAYVRQNYAYPIGVADIADYVGIDRTYLYKLFMKAEHCAPKQYLMRYRLGAAEQMLANGGYSVTETAYSCGFRDASAFCGFFRTEKGISPAKYRKNHQAATEYEQHQPEFGALPV